MVKYFCIDIDPAVINNIECQDVGPSFVEVPDCLDLVRAIYILD